MKTDSMCVFYIMLNGSAFSGQRVVVHQGDASRRLSGAVYLTKEGQGTHLAFIVGKKINKELIIITLLSVSLQ